MKKLPIYEKVFYAIFILFIAILAYTKNRESKKYIISRLKEFPAISYKNGYSGLVTNTYEIDKTLVRNNSNSLDIELNDTIYISIETSNELFTDLDLEDVLCKDARILKKELSDTLYVYNIDNHDTIRYTFIIWDQSSYRRRYLK